MLIECSMFRKKISYYCVKQVRTSSTRRPYSQRKRRCESIAFFVVAVGMCREVPASPTTLT